ncbi:hypothetical protein CORC01_12878 [Colletotrichum orchidophilum]|uniref:CFEM domain-containing protein n=1 Tax=Colletotrichum orchidophilum TaxID=1209926 RepID=A0A1G4ARK4_9PEZI|nr:uncharacterized protein CORC01_12878 [Colletotrichum orchidophilum]OHE91804.1 hypothetical protein CORC01_12878 [Colletotrichum orchidophilum]
MRFHAVAIALVGFAAAQDTQLPTCAQGCVNQYTTGGAIANCSQVDVKCICSNSGFLDGIACCLAGVCSTTDQENAVKFAKNICTGADVAVPDQVVCKTASLSSTATATHASAAATGASASATNTANAAHTTNTPTHTPTNTPNAAPTMGPVALLGGLIAALVAL